jgi:EAL domain-containing protein (putative c-di-GMP-specific phosphodiesterase class I)
MTQSPDSSTPVRNEITRVLIVEDEPLLREAYRRMLSRAGFVALSAASASEAISQLQPGLIDVVVSDINLPGMSGNDLLKAIRAVNLDIPVILITGFPTIESATDAVEFGALRYLVKPVDPAALISAIETAAKLSKVANLQRDALGGTEGYAIHAKDRAGKEAAFEQGLSKIWIAYHPIVCMSKRRVIGYEALVRTLEPSIPHPGVFFGLAEQLGRLNDIGRVIRMRVAQEVAKCPPGIDFYVNVHPEDLFDERLFCGDCPLSEHAERVVLEITERAALKDSSGAKARIGRLRDMGYRIAIDDLGEGYAGLNYLASLSPNVVKLDMALIRSIHLDPVKQRLVDAMNSLCHGLGMSVIAEGIESSDEQATLKGIGCDIHQGFYYARPGPPFPSVAWE